MKSITELLPPETIDQIIGAVADNDNNDNTQYQFKMRDVKACSLTCQTLATICRPHIFRSVRVFDSLPVGNYVDLGARPFPFLTRSFGRVLAKRPEIADHVRHLVHYIRPSTDDDPVPVPFELQALKKLEKISIHTEFGYVEWPTLVGSASWPLVMELMSHPTFTSLEIETPIEFNIADLATCGHLRHLTLIRARPCQGPPLPGPPNSPMKLRELTISYFTTLFVDIMTRQYSDGTPVVDKQELRKVSITGDFGEKVIEFLDLTTNLEQLRLPQVWLETQDAEYIPRLLSTPLRTLKSLYLGLAFFADTKHDILKILKNISAQNCIERLTLIISCHHYFYSDDSETTPTPDWESIKNCVLSLAWPSLAQVNLRMFTALRDTSSPTVVNGPVMFTRLPGAQCLVEVPYNFK